MAESRAVVIFKSSQTCATRMKCHREHAPTQADASFSNLRHQRVSDSQWPSTLTSTTTATATSSSSTIPKNVDNKPSDAHTRHSIVAHIPNRAHAPALFRNLRTSRALCPPTTSSPSHPSPFRWSHLVLVMDVCRTTFGWGEWGGRDGRF